MPKRDPIDDIPPKLVDAVQSLVRDWAVQRLDVGDTADFIARLDRDELSIDESRDYYLAALTVQKMIGSYADALLTPCGELAAAYGADVADLAAALGISRQGVHKRWGRADPNLTRVAVVISRTDTVHHFPGDSRVLVGEVGGPAQYDSDRGWWIIGEKVRAAARHAIIGVDTVTDRVYEIDPTGWTQNPLNSKWQFTAVGHQPLTDSQIAAAAARGDLPLVPGDPCPRRYMNAYLPYWF